MSGSSDMPLSIEPMVGWRVWRLQRRRGVLTLVSITGGDAWPPQEVLHARCRNHRGHAPPQPGCTCGIYAAATPEDLAAASVFGDQTSVVGAVAMWGRVVEHARGSRAAAAYPARLTLACIPCVRAGVKSDPEIVVDRAGWLTALCRNHALVPGAGGQSASAVQQELLATYGVELLPRERIAHGRVGAAPTDARRILNGAVTLFLGLIKLVATLFALPLFIGAILLFIALGVQAVTGNASAEGTTGSTSASESPLAVEGAVERDPAIVAEPHGAVPPPRTIAFPDFSFVCGIGRGPHVELVPCDQPSDLWGASERATPKGKAVDCLTPSDAYTRGPHYWICWYVVDDANVRPWPGASNPFTTPPERGGVL